MHAVQNGSGPNARWLRFATHRLAPIVSAVVLSCAGCEPDASQESSHGIHLIPVEWEYEGHTIHGIAAEGTSLHGVNIGEVPRDIKILLMPMGWMGDQDIPQNPHLDYRTPVKVAPDGKYIAIDLRHGAGMADLGELSAQARSQIIDSVLESVQKNSATELPGVSEQQLRAWRGYILEATHKDTQAESLSELTAANATQRTQIDRAAIEAAYAFWPMIFSFTVAAGSESTQVVFVSLPRSDANTNSVIAKLIEGASAQLSIEADATPMDMNVGENYRTDITNGAPNIGTPDQQDHAAMEYAQNALAAGWEAHFGTTEDGP